MSRPSSPWTKSTAADSTSTTSASTGSPRSAAHSSEEMSTADAPSVSGVELPAVMVGSASRPRPKTGLSLPSFSAVESARRLVSRVTPLNGVIRSEKKPSS